MAEIPMRKQKLQEVSVDRITMRGEILWVIGKITTIIR